MCSNDVLANDRASRKIQLREALVGVLFQVRDLRAENAEEVASLERNARSRPLMVSVCVWMVAADQKTTLFSGVDAITKPNERRRRRK
jgi:hypothetical protein